MPPNYEPQYQSASSDLLPGCVFVKDYKYALLDAHAQSSGTCQVRFMDGYGVCFNGPLEIRYVVKCRPVWNLAGGAAPRTQHLPPEPISIYVPPNMSDLNGVIDQAINDWNTAMATTGLSLGRVTAPCGSAGDCVNVQEGPVQSGCAIAVPGVLTPPEWVRRLEQSRIHQVGPSGTRRETGGPWRTSLDISWACIITVARARTA